MSRLRVINVGLPKTGTTTLNKALRRAGLKVADWRIRKRQTPDAELVGKHVGALIYQGYFGNGDPLALLDEFDAITEMSYVKFNTSAWPQTDWALLAAIRDRHPGAKFLLSHRDPDKTAQSMKNWSNLGEKRLPVNAIPGLPKGYGQDVGELARWVAGHYAFCRQVFAGSDRFLEYEVEDPEAPTRIGTFLERDLPWWGTENKARKRQFEDAQ